MYNKVETIALGVSIFFIVFGLYLTLSTNILTREDKNLKAAVIEPALVSVDDTDNFYTNNNNLNKSMDNALKINDIKIGEGDGVKPGDEVIVHYSGTLSNGEEFDNSKLRNQPFEFKVGKGMVIEGWDKGILGMKPGGTRVLVIPPEMAYGSTGFGPIPPNATLTFTIELLEIK